MRVVSVLFLAMGLIACQSHLNVKVDVYGGQTLPVGSSIDSTDGAPFVEEAARVCLAVQEDMSRLGVDLGVTTDAVQKLRSGYARELADASKQQEYVAEAEKRIVAARTIIEEILAKKGKVERGSLEKHLVRRPDAPALARLVDDFLYPRLKFILKIDADHEELFQLAWKASTEPDAESRTGATEKLMTKVIGDQTKAEALKKQLQELKPTPGSLALSTSDEEQYAGALKSVLESSKQISGRAAGAAKQIAERCSVIHPSTPPSGKDAPKGSSAQGSAATGVQGIRSALSEVKELAGELLGGKPELKQLVQVWRDALLEDLSDPLYASAAEKLPPQDKASIKGQLELKEVSVPEVKEHLAIVSSMVDGLERQERRLKAYVQTLPSGKQFQTVDPNIGTILAKENEKEWREAGLDSVHLDGAGEAQYILVQETPTSYRIKEFHSDPQAVANLALSVSDVGMQLLSTVAASTGVPVPKLAKAEVPETSVPDLEPDARLMEASYDRSMRQIHAYLVEEDTALGAAGADVELARQKLLGRLRGQRRLIEMMKARLDGLVPASTPQTTGEAQ